MIGLSSVDCDKYISGLKKYESRGVGILIDGKKGSEIGLRKILQHRDVGSFYLGSYIEDEKGVLREIRFNKILYK